MASQGRTPTREDDSRLSMSTLAIASAASAAAAIVVSQFWIAGTPIAAAITPVVVALVSELLHRPTEAVARRMTTESTALLPQATGAGAPEEGEPEPEPPARDLEGEPAPVRVYRTAPRRRRLHPKVIALTGVLAFLIAAAALTLPELISGGSIGKGDRNTTLFGGRNRDRNSDQPQSTTPTEETPPPEDQPTEPQPTTPAEEPPAEEPPATTEEPLPTVPTTPQVPPPASP